ncbi:hypothetical protein [Chryseobacterium lactis]|nr:hypothetical protein [Chryseobacterium lactis]
MIRILYIVSCSFFVCVSTDMYSQFGINTTTPQKTLHVNGDLEVDNEISVGGDAQTAGDSGLAGQTLVSNGPGQPPVWKDISLAPDQPGTVIVVNGQFLIAQEITVQISADYSGQASANTAIPLPIGNLNNEILDNNNTYSGSATSNSFQVVADGVYQIYVNMQLTTTANTYPMIGIWDDTTGSWVTNVNDLFIAGNFQSYTIITSVPMFASRTYSFRAQNTANYTIKQLSGGTTGSGPVSQVTVRRLK